jgi:GntR family transcriptional regulator of vanillate catabolism
MVERLGMSRTPIRTALVRLQEEGLLEPLAGGGFVVRDFSEADIRDAIELRGTLEGLAARLAAERGVAAGLLGALRECLARLDEVLAPSTLSEAAFSSYVALNGRFHALLSQASGSALVQRQIERASALPFASPNGFVLVHTTGRFARDRLVIAHEQHRAVVEAIAAGEGSRAEALMREHARNAHTNLTVALAHQPSLHKLPGAGLIRRTAAV